MVKSREFHSQILKRGKKRGWHWIKGEGDGSHRIYEDKNGIRYPVPYHGAKEMLNWDVEKLKSHFKSM